MVMDGAASSETYVGHYGALGSTFAKLEKVNGRVTDSFVYVIMQNINLYSRKSILVLPFLMPTRIIFQNSKLYYPKMIASKIWQ